MKVLKKIGGGIISLSCAIALISKANAEQVCTISTVYDLNDCVYIGFTSDGFQKIFFKNFNNYATPSPPLDLEMEDQNLFNDTVVYSYGSCSVVTEDIEDCNNRPEANFHVQQEQKWLGGVNKVTITNISNDDDNDALTYTWWIDGVLQNSTSPSIQLYTALAKIVTIELRVSDGELFDSKTRDVSLLAWSCDKSCNLY